MKTIADTALSKLSALRQSIIKDEWWFPIRRIQITLTNPIIEMLAKLNRLELVRGPLTYNQDGLASIHNCDFVLNEAFLRAYQAGEATDSWLKCSIGWRVFVICWAAQHAMQLDGDFVECGTNRGGFARSIIEFTHFEKSNKNFFLLDTFCGLVDRCISPEERTPNGTAGIFSECFEQVSATFRKFPNIVIIRGIVPDTLPLVKSDHIAFLSIDMNCAEPEIAAGEFFWDKLVSGAVIVLDDYAYAGYITQKHAWDNFASVRNTMVLALPTGQGILIKP